MKLKYIPTGSPDCPLIRLYDYHDGEVENLRAACRDLADGRIQQFSLHEQPWVESIDACQFTWRACREDIGVRDPQPGQPFVLDFSDEAWREVEDKLLPFAQGTRGFNWLTNEGTVAVLITKDGGW